MNAITTNIQASAVAERAMLSGLHVRQWSGRKLDKRVTDEVNRQHGAAADAGRYNKALLSKDALADILRVAGEARAEHYARTLPWHDDGARVLSAAGYLAYAETMRTLRAKFDAAVSQFVEGYSDFVDDARVRLNGMFAESDYPTAGEIGKRFSFDISIMPMPTAEDFRVTLGDAAAEAIRADIERRLQEATAAAMRDVYSRIADHVGRMVERLNAYRPASAKGDKSEGIFRDSLVENVRALVELLPSLNLTADPHLTEVAERMGKSLCRYDASALRDDELARKETAAAAQSILDDVSDYLA